MLVDAGIENDGLNWLQIKIIFFSLLFYELCDDEKLLLEVYYRISLSIIYMKVNILTSING